MNQLFAATVEITFHQEFTLLLGAGLLGLAFGGFARSLVCVLLYEGADRAESWDFDAQRRLRLRNGSPLFRRCELLIDELRSVRWLHLLGGKARVERALKSGCERLPWTAAEFLGAKAIEGIVVSAAVLVVGSQFFSWKIVIPATLVAVIGYIRAAAATLESRAKRRVGQLKQRLPFSIDMLALMMEAGAGFREGLATVIRENEGHPLGEELGTVLSRMSNGQSLRQSFSQLEERLPDEDIGELVFSIVKAEELGTPLSQTLLSMADRLRLKRSQWAEKAAGQAQTMITFPGLLIMVACLIIVVAPFVISAVKNSVF